MKTLSVFTPSRVSCPDSSSSVHRFLISGPDLGIDARFSPFTRSCVHRFLISSPDLRIDAAENCLPAAAVAATLFRVRLYFTLLQRGMVSPATVVCGIDMKRPILIFVAAKKKGPHASPSDLQDEWPACRMIVPDAGGNRRGQDATKAA